jgi:hypothetical protein
MVSGGCGEVQLGGKKKKKSNGGWGNTRKKGVRLA